MVNEKEMVEILDVVHKTEKAMLCVVRIRANGEDHEWETWIPSSVVNKRAVAPWFQEKLVERFGQEMAGGG
jgi:hypothetical protein